MADIWMDVDAALAEVPVNIMPLLDDTDFKTREVAIAYDAAGMDLRWNFVTTAGAYTSTAVTPTTSGNYDWAHQGDGMYSIEIPASGGASINNDTEGFGWFTGFVTGVLPWRGPVIGFRASGLNDLLIDSAFSTTRGLAGTALPAAAADAAGGLVISDAGGLDADAQRADVAAILVDTGTTLDGRIPAALVSGRMDASVGAMAANTLTAAATAADFSTEVNTAVVALLGTPAGASVSADIAAVKVDTAAILVDTGTTLDGRIPAALVGGRMDANVGAISSDATAADNAEAFFDGTGYAGTGNVIPSVTTVTGNVNGSVGSVTGAVGSVGAGGITASSIAADAIGASELAADAVTEIAAGVLAAVVEGTTTVVQTLRLANSANGAKLSGAATTTVAIRDLADSKDRVSATVDADGNRSAVTLDLT